MTKFKAVPRKQRGQTGLEFLLVIAGAVLVVAIVGYTLKTTVSTIGDQVTSGSSQDITGEGSLTGSGGSTPAAVTCSGTAPSCSCADYYGGGIYSSGSYAATCNNPPTWECGAPPSDACRVRPDVVDDGIDGRV